MIRRWRKHAVVLLTSLPLVGVSYAATPTAVLRLIPDTTVPALQVTLQVNVTNGSSVDITLDPFAELKITDPSGNSFLASGSSFRPGNPIRARLADDGDPRLILHSGESREFFFGIGSNGCAPEFFGDRHFLTTGKFPLQLVFNPHDPEDDALDRSFLTNAASLTVSEPKGNDAQVLQRLLALGSGPGIDCVVMEAVQSDPSKAEDALAKFPQSAYAPFLAILAPAFRGESVVARVAWLERVLNSDPSQPVADLVALNLGQIHAHQVGEDLTTGDPQSAIAHAERAKAILDRLARSSPYPFVSGPAGDALKDVPSMQQILLQYQDHLHAAAPAPEKVLPVALCVDSVPGDPRFIGRFAYNNPNAVGKNLPVGPLNAFSPPPVDRGQPRFFSPGRNDNVVGAVSKEPVIWSLDGSSATARPGSTPACTTDGALPVRPFVDCIQKGEDAVVVWFGYENPNMYPVRVPAGPQNHVEPASAAAGQLTIFFPGFHRDAWKATIAGSASISWTLGTSSVSASAAQGFKCSGNERGDD